MAKSYRQYTQCLKNSAEISQFAWLPISVFRQTVYWFYASVHVLVIVCVCMREREGGELWLLCGTELNMCPVLHVSNLHVLLIVLIFTAVAGKRPRSFCQKFRWQVTANTHTPYICGFAWSDMVHGCMVYTERAEMAAVSCGTSHASTVSTPLQGIFKNAL